MQFVFHENFMDSHLSRRLIDQFRVKISRLCKIPGIYILIAENGRFSINDLDELDANHMLYDLKSIAYNVTIAKGRYDFTHYYGVGLPKLKCTITGFLKVEDNLSGK